MQISSTVPYGTVVSSGWSQCWPARSIYQPRSVQTILQYRYRSPLYGSEMSTEGNNRVIVRFKVLPKEVSAEEAPRQILRLLGYSQGQGYDFSRVEIFQEKPHRRRLKGTIEFVNTSTTKEAAKGVGPEFCQGLFTGFHALEVNITGNQKNTGRRARQTSEVANVDVQTLPQSSENCNAISHQKWIRPDAVSGIIIASGTRTKERVGSWRSQFKFHGWWSEGH